MRTFPENMADASETEGLRKRVISREEKGSGDIKLVHAKRIATTDKAPLEIEAGTFWLTRIILLRSVAFIYFVAFLVAFHQNKALIGKDGLLPVDKHMDMIRKHAKNDLLTMFNYAPTLLWYVDYRDGPIDNYLDYLALTGLVWSGIVMVTGAANMVVMLTLWVLYHSIANVGQRFYSFGWESQLLETGFLATFLCPVFSLRRLPARSHTSFLIILAFRWLIFRIMLGAGLIKIRGDRCWWPDLTCMDYHYQTQPVPNPVSPYLHAAPHWWHATETMGNHFVELVAPFLLLLGRRMTIVGGVIQVLFQMILIISGNLSFLNWLTIVPSLACFDDRSVQRLFSSHTRKQVAALQREHRERKRSLGEYVRCAFSVCVAGMIAYLSIPIVQNLVSSRQIMNTSFDPFRIVNTYGAFGSVTKERTEVIVEGTSARDASDPMAIWLEYEFKCKPGNVTRRPCLISPYHYRLDWLMWFAAFQKYQQNDWFVHLMAKLLHNDELVSDLMDKNPFLESGNPPRWVRAEHYLYEYSPVAGGTGEWWTRRRIGTYMPPVNTRMLRDFMDARGWRVPRPHGGSQKPPRS